MTPSQVLIVGAGPTGLVLALALARHKVPVRIIDTAAEPGKQSRAMGVQARTLELYRQFGIADEIVNEGIPFSTAHLLEKNWFSEGHHEVVRWSIQNAGKGLSPYPFVLSHPQDLHERLLLRHLEGLGILVERRTRLLSFTQDDERVTAKLEGPQGDEEAEFNYLCGCDGAHSIVRQTLGVGFEGGTYPQSYYVADVKMDGSYDTDSYLNVGAKAFGLMMPVRTTGMHRLVGLIPPNLPDHDVQFEQIRDHVEGLLGNRVESVNWFAQWRSHHRLATQFRRGRIFLLGDSAHVHSPVGGQGMNTGIGDAINLGWKLAEVLHGHLGASILDSYESERMAFAKVLVSTTDRAFTALTSQGVLGWFFRRLVFPVILTLVTSFTFARRMGFLAISQLKVHYRQSSISEGKVGKICGGDRLPWVDYGKTDNFEPINGIDWQLHIYGDAVVELGDLQWIPLHRFPFSKEAAIAGLKSNATYLIRPDGYVGLALARFDVERVGSYLERLQMNDR